MTGWESLSTHNCVNLSSLTIETYDIFFDSKIHVQILDRITVNQNRRSDESQMKKVKLKEDENEKYLNSTRERNRELTIQPIIIE